MDTNSKKDQRFLPKSTAKRLNLGCGSELWQGYENADKFYKHPLVTYCDIDKTFPWKNNTFDYIWTRHTLEHGKDKRHSLQECYRILKPNGTIEIIVPHVLDNLQLGDVGHYSMFSTHTFAKLNKDHKRQYSQGMTWEIQLIEFENVQPMILKGFYNKHKHIAENYLGRIFPPRALHVIMKAIK